MAKKLCKSRSDIKIDGVCAGVAAYLGLDATLVRLIWIIASTMGAGTGLIAYFVCALVIPREPEILDYTQQN